MPAVTEELHCKFYFILIVQPHLNQHRSGLSEGKTKEQSVVEKGKIERPLWPEVTRAGLMPSILSMFLQLPSHTLNQREVLLTQSCLLQPCTTPPESLVKGLPCIQDVLVGPASC